MPFDIAIKGNAYMTIEGDTVRILLRMEPREKDTLRKQIAPEITSEARLDLSLFADRQQAQEWINATHTSFKSKLWDFLTQEAARLQSDIANQKLDALGIEEIDMRDIVEQHASKTEAHLREILKLQGIGNFSLWTRLDLTRDVRDALKWLSGRDRNYEKVAARLQNLYGDKAPASAGALKQLLRRHKIDWKELKKGTVAISKED
jgi:hypothetical protein